MKLELIVPAANGGAAKGKKTLIPPLGMAMIAALTPAGVEVTLTDENVSPIDLEKETDLVGITALTNTAHRAYSIADAFRKKGVKVVLGGIHPSLLPEEAGRHADAVVIGEAEGIWQKLIEDFKANNLQRLYKQVERPSLLSLPVPRRDLFAKGKYYVSHTMSNARGCPYSCSFCTVTSFFGHTYRCRPVEEIVRELQTFQERKFIAFLDDNVVGNPKFAKDLFRAIIPYKIKWAGQCSVTVARDDELLKLAAASGCVSLLIGFESLSTANLTAVSKKINAVEEYESVIRKIHSHGIAVHGFFIFGFDDDDEGVFARTVQFAKKMRLESAQFDFLTPYPGTAFYRSMDEEGRILTKDWSRYGYEIVFEPKRMSRETLRKGHDWAWRQFYSLPSISKRVGVVRPNLRALWIVNLAYRSRWHGSGGRHDQEGEK